MQQKTISAPGATSSADLSGVVSWDVSTYDIPRAVREAPDLGVPQSPRNLRNIFGTETDIQTEASAIEYVKPGGQYPPFLIIYVGIFDTSGDAALQTLSKVQSEAFADALTTAGASARVYGEMDRTHSSIALKFGMEDDGITAETGKFLDRIIEPRDP